MEFLKDFTRSETGAITVDWVVLTASIVGLVLALMAVLSSGLENVSGNINTTLSNENLIQTTFAE